MKYNRTPFLRNVALCCVFVTSTFLLGRGVEAGSVVPDSKLITRQCFGCASNTLGQTARIQDSLSNILDKNGVPYFPKGDISGKFDLKTKTSLENFQRDLGVLKDVSVTGTNGPVTTSFINEFINEKARNSFYQARGAAGYYLDGKKTQDGSKIPVVDISGAGSPSKPSASVSTYTGTLNGVPVYDGGINSVKTPVGASNDGATSESLAATGPRLCMGCNNDSKEVTLLQKILKEADHYTGSITGIYDSKTAIGVKGLQHDNGITESGAVGANTRALIIKIDKANEDQNGGNYYSSVNYKEPGHPADAYTAAVNSGANNNDARNNFVPDSVRRGVTQQFMNSQDALDQAHKDIANEKAGVTSKPTPLQDVRDARDRRIAQEAAKKAEEDSYTDAFGNLISKDKSIADENRLLADRAARDQEAREKAREEAETQQRITDQPLSPLATQNVSDSAVTGVTVTPEPLVNIQPTGFFTTVLNFVFGKDEPSSNPPVEDKGGTPVNQQNISNVERESIIQGFRDTSPGGDVDRESRGRGNGGGGDGGEGSAFDRGMGEGGGGGGCFVAGTKILMSDMSYKNIEEVKVGDKVKTPEGFSAVEDSMVFEYNGDIYAYNHSNNYFFTPNHPFMTFGGWKSFDPSLSMKESPDISVSTTTLGDTLVKISNPEKIKSIQKKYSKGFVYNITVSGSHTYFANGYLVHNKMSEDTPGDNWEGWDYFW